MARIALYKAEMDEAADVLRWVDRTLIKFCQKVGDFQPQQPHTFNLNPLFSHYPAILFHLRRSQFLQVFNNSPDETAYYRHVVLNEQVEETIVMIQPSLMRYTYNNPMEPEPVLLDSDSVTSDSVLLLDTYFHILIHHGTQVADWIQQGLHKTPEYKQLEVMMSQPIEDAKELLVDRFPVPRYIVCDQNTSQARFLLARLNPSSGTGQGQAIFTDDVSMQVFMDSLKKLVTNAT